MDMSGKMPDVWSDNIARAAFCYAHFNGNSKEDGARRRVTPRKEAL